MPKVRLKVVHTHAGVVYQAGSIIDVDDYTARWIISRGLGEIFDELKQLANTVDSANSADSADNVDSADSADSADTVETTKNRKFLNKKKQEG